ncbi:hypothetical protein, partial [Cronobacter sakazakii]|uniref:hypothetical protein n=1 Tax=Cronobacter sakazakii TaxID=28141 RepID=UPI0018F86578
SLTRWFMQGNPLAKIGVIFFSFWVFPSCCVTALPAASGGLITSLTRWFMQGNPLAKIGVIFFSFWVFPSCCVTAL